MRVVVYDTVDVPSMDIEGTSDIMVKVGVGEERRETDCHYRCSNGRGSFNYRLVFRVKAGAAGRKRERITVQVWDRDLFKTNDFISELQLDLTPLLDDCILTSKPISLTKSYYHSYLQSHLLTPLTFPDPDYFYLQTQTATGLYGGKVRIGLTVLPKELADSNPVGLGRTDPNHSPYLSPPIGRLKLTVNPLKMLEQLVGPKIMRKIYLYGCLIVCLVLCVMMLPVIMSNLVTKGIVAIFT